MKKRLLSLVLAFAMLFGGFMMGGDVAFAQEMEYEYVPPVCAVCYDSSATASRSICEPERVKPKCAPIEIESIVYVMCYDSNAVASRSICKPARVLPK